MFGSTEHSLPPWIPPGEVSQLCLELIPNYVKQIQAMPSVLQLLQEYKSKLKGPLQLYWICYDDLPKFACDFTANTTPIICLSASRLSQTDRYYIQGAGDDEESWSHHIRPELFWANQAEMLEASLRLHSGGSLAEFEGYLATLEEEPSSIPMEDCQVWQNVKLVPTEGFVLAPNQRGVDLETVTEGWLHVPIPSGKKDKNKLTRALPAILEGVVEQPLMEWVFHHSDPSILAAVAVGLGFTFVEVDDILCFQTRQMTEWTKSLVKLKIAELATRCSWIQTVPRFMLNDLNRFIMTPPHLLPKILTEKS